MEGVERSLHARLDAGVDPALIKSEVEAEFAVYSRVRIRDFVPILVETRLRHVGDSRRDTHVGDCAAIALVEKI